MAKSLKARLTHQDYYKLVEWVKANKDFIESNNFNQTETCRFASKALEFAVATTSLRDVCELLGDEAPTFSTSECGSSSDTRLNTACTNISRIRNAVRIIAESLGDADLLHKVNRALSGRPTEPKEE